MQMIAVMRMMNLLEASEPAWMKTPTEARTKTAVNGSTGGGGGGGGNGGDGGGGLRHS